MRIIGGRDYYDSGLAWGVDEGIIFVRSPRELAKEEARLFRKISDVNVRLSTTEENPRHRSAIHTGYSRWSRGRLNKIFYALQPHIVIFCGKIYRGIEIVVGDSGDDVHFFWDAERLHKWAAERNLAADAVRTINSNSRELDFEIREVSEEQLAFLLNNRISIIRRAMAAQFASQDHYGIWIANDDGLKDIEFSKAVNAINAFQDLSQWVGGTLASYGPETVEITDDKVKIAKHGFDKHSFRKGKGE